MKKAILAFLCVLGLALHAWAGNGDSNQQSPVQPSYAVDNQLAAFRAATSSADVLSFDACNVAASQASVSPVSSAFNLNNRQTLKLSGRFSNAGANCVVYVVWCSYNANSGVTNETGHAFAVTLLADSVSSQDELFEAPVAFVDGGGANWVYFFIKSISSGSVTLWVGSE